MFCVTLFEQVTAYVFISMFACSYLFWIVFYVEDSKIILGEETRPN